MAPPHDARDGPRHRARDGMGEPRGFYPRVPGPIWNHAVRLSKGSRKVLCRHQLARPGSRSRLTQQGEIMPKKSANDSIRTVTHRLTLEIARPHAAVWKAFTGDVHSWWPKDFYATESTKRIVFEVKPGGRLYEDAGNGNGLVWYHVIALDAPNSVRCRASSRRRLAGRPRRFCGWRFPRRANQPP